MNKLVQKLYYKYIYLAASFLFLIQFVWLFSNTPDAEVDWLEIAKILGPISLISGIYFFSDRIKLRIVIVLFHCLILHFISAFVITLNSGFGAFFTSDLRLNFSVIGRGATETAWAASVLLVSGRYLHSIRRLRFDFFGSKVFGFICVSICVLSQSRSSILYLAVYYLTFGVDKIRKFRIKSASIISGFFVILVVISLMQIDFVSDIVSNTLDRTKSADKILTGRNYIWEVKLESIFNNSPLEIIFGKDLLPKIDIIEELAYETADAHNVMIDLIQYYGIFGFLGIGSVYWFLGNSRGKHQRAVKYAFTVMSMFASSFRFPYIFYVNIIIITIIFINTDSESYEKR